MFFTQTLKTPSAVEIEPPDGLRVPNRVTMGSLLRPLEPNRTNSTRIGKRKNFFRDPALRN